MPEKVKLGDVVIETLRLPAEPTEVR